MTPEEFAHVAALADHAFRELVDRDWSVPAGGLDWSCRQTLDHIVDCVFSYALQLAARSSSGFLPFNPLHATPEASIHDLIAGFDGVAQMFCDVAGNAPPGTVASDGVLVLAVDDWCARAAYEVGLHTYDIVTGLGARWQMPDDLCGAITASDALWMFDRTAAVAGDTPWAGLLAGSGRAMTS